MTLNHVRSTKKRQKGRHTTLIDSKEMQNQPQVNDTQGTQTLPEQTKRRQKKNVNKRFQETASGTTTKPMTPARSKQRI
jgi:hypothetical protein